MVSEYTETATYLKIYSLILCAVSQSSNQFQTLLLTLQIADDSLLRNIWQNSVEYLCTNPMEKDDSSIRASQGSCAVSVTFSGICCHWFWLGISIFMFKCVKQDRANGWHGPSACEKGPVWARKTHLEELPWTLTQWHTCI